ncbi:agmatinase, partial [bacterium]
MNCYGADQNFLGICTYHQLDEAKVVVLPIPLEQTTTYKTGTVHGPEGLLLASHQVELYDDELRVETYLNGIATLEAMDLSELDMDESLQVIESKVSEILEIDKKPVLIGGEHSLTIGAIRAFHQKFPNLYVLHLDAHADLRDNYQGTPNNHACVMARVRELCRFTSVGIRSLCRFEADVIQTGFLDVWDMHRFREDSDSMEKIIKTLDGPVYITLDLDVFDPSVIPNVGTPEPGGMEWVETLSLLKKVFESHQVVGLDIVELCPQAGSEYGVFHA